MFLVGKFNLRKAAFEWLFSLQVIFFDSFKFPNRRLF